MTNALIATNVFVNNEYVGSVSNGKSFSIYLYPEVYQIGVTGGNARMNTSNVSIPKNATEVIIVIDAKFSSFTISDVQVK